METKILTTPELPKHLPHGWKTGVAKVLEINPATVRRNIEKGYGPTYDRIMKAAACKYGKKKENNV